MCAGIDIDRLINGLHISPGDSSVSEYLTALLGKLLFHSIWLNVDFTCVVSTVVRGEVNCDTLALCPGGSVALISSHPLVPMTQG